jgi:DNA-binding MarR family transcriptional regulator
MGELVDHLERRGYVERRLDPRDGRAKIVVPTEKGRWGIKAAAERIAQIEAEVAGRMGEEGLEELIGSLAELTAILDEPEDVRTEFARQSP